MFSGFSETVDAESATTILLGERTKQHPDGVTCDFTAYPKDHFDSDLGRVSFDDRLSLGSCWEVDNQNILISQDLKANYLVSPQCQDV